MSSSLASARTIKIRTKHLSRRRRLVLGGQLLEAAFDRLDCEGVDQRYLLQAIEASRRAAVTGLHVDIEKNGAAARHRGAQARDPLRRLPIGDARIGEAAEREDRRIPLRPDVLVWRVGQDGPE